MLSSVNHCTKDNKASYWIVHDEDYKLEKYIKDLIYCITWLNPRTMIAYEIDDYEAQTIKTKTLSPKAEQIYSTRKEKSIDMYGSIDWSLFVEDNLYEHDNIIFDVYLAENIESNSLSFIENQNPDWHIEQLQKQLAGKPIYKNKLKRTVIDYDETNNNKIIVPPDLTESPLVKFFDKYIHIQNSTGSKGNSDYGMDEQYIHLDRPTAISKTPIPVVHIGEYLYSYNNKSIS